MEHHFTVTAKTLSGVPVSWETEIESGDRLEVSVPSAFQGPGVGYSPEDLYVLSLLNCWFATFKVIAAKSKFEFETLEGTATITTGKNAEGLLWIPKMHVDLILTSPSDADKAQRLLDMASKHCLILNSVNTEKSWNLEIE
jgi:organic hydroperoxide reductase OsmC/OhrA